jgi:chromosome partitioning protein
MIITVAAHKGGVGKSTTAFHLAAYWGMQGQRVVLIDGDENRSILKWQERCQEEQPFVAIAPHQQADYFLKAERKPDLIIVDTQARPAPDDLKDLAASASLLVVPSTPDATSLDALAEFLGDLQQLPPVPYRVLLTRVSPPPNTDGKDAYLYLEKENVPTFSKWIREYKAFQKAALAGVPVGMVRGDRNAKLGWNDYCAVAKEIERCV